MRALALAVHPCDALTNVGRTRGIADGQKAKGPVQGLGAAERARRSDQPLRKIRRGEGALVSFALALPALPLGGRVGQSLRSALSLSTNARVYAMTNGAQRLALGGEGRTSLIEVFMLGGLPLMRTRCHLGTSATDQVGQGGCLARGIARCLLCTAAVPACGSHVAPRYPCRADNHRHSRCCSGVEWAAGRFLASGERCTWHCSHAESPGRHSRRRHQLRMSSRAPAHRLG